MAEIINKIAQSPLVELNLEDYYPSATIQQLDISTYLDQGLVLREKPFRETLKQQNWSIYKDTYVGLVCSTDAIVPTWAYMLLTIYLEPLAKKIVVGNLQVVQAILFEDALSTINIEQFANAKVVIKGCSKLPVPEYAYVEITRKLRPVAQSIMYGEPCSTVPLYKRN